MITAGRFKWLAAVECNINKIIFKPSKRSRDMRAIVLRAVAVAALVLMTAGVAVAEDTYVIISSGTGFTALKDDERVGPANAVIQNVIDAIKADAQGNACTIRFGTGNNVLDIGSANIEFDGGAGGADWGEITLAGKLKSSYGAENSGTIYLTNGASVEIVGEINGESCVVYNTSGTVTVGVGTIDAHDDYWLSYGIYNESGTVIISSSGRVSSAGDSRAYGVYNESGTVTISGGTIVSTIFRSWNDEAPSSGIYNESGTVTISGGMVGGEPSTVGVINGDDGTVIITGGRVDYIRNETGTVTISDSADIGWVSGTSGTVTLNGGTVWNISGDGISITDGTVGSISGQRVTITGGKVSGSVTGTVLMLTGGEISGSLTGTMGITITGGSIGSDVTCGSGSIGLGGSPEIGGRITARQGYVSITTFDPIFAPADKIYALTLTGDYLIDEAAVRGGAEFLSNFLLCNATDYRLAASDDDIVIKYTTATPYTVRFNLNSGTGTRPDSIRVLSGSKLPYVPTAGFTRSGYIGDGKWYTDSSGTTEFVFGANGTAVTSDITLYLKWVQNNSILSFDRLIPNGNTGEVAVVAPVAALSGELAVGPNPVGKSSGGVVFFWNGKQIKSGALTVYDASGNVVRKLGIKDNAVTGNVSKRAVVSWDLKDAKGRQVSEGTYLVKGKVVTFGGKGERAAVVVGVR